MSAVPDRLSSGTPLPPCVCSSLVPPSFLLRSHFGWIVNAFQFQYQNIIGVEFALVGTAALDSFEFSGASHEAPTTVAVHGTLFRQQLTPALPGQFFAIVKGV